MEIALYALIALVGLWVLFKVVMGIVSVPMAKRDRNSPGGQAIHHAVRSAGYFDGTDGSRRRAQEAFVDLALKGPFPISTHFGSVDELAEAFSHMLNISSGPILLEAAYGVVAAHRVSYPEDARATTAAERDRNLEATSMLISLYPQWSKKHQTGTVAGLVEQKLRFALVTWLLLDRCERDGLLPDSEAGVR